MTWVKWAQENGQLPIRRDPPKPGLSNGSSVEVGYGPDKSCYRRTSSCPKAAAPTATSTFVRRPADR